MGIDSVEGVMCIGRYDVGSRKQEVGISSKTSVYDSHPPSEPWTRS